MVISLPDFDVDFWPAANSFTFVVQVEWVVPHGKVINLIPDFFVGLAVVFATEQSPVGVTTAHLILAKDATDIKTRGSFDFSDQVYLGSIRAQSHFSFKFKLQEV